jgi:acyl-CoA synthetase (AMP-forming)/AMP-acid ligase II
LTSKSEPGKPAALGQPEVPTHASADIDIYVEINIGCVRGSVPDPGEVRAAQPVPGMTTIPEVLADRAERWGDVDAVVDGAQRLTFADLAVEAARVAAGFASAGVERGDRVAIWAPNRYEWILSALGLQLAGAALVPLNTRFKGAEVADILARTRARALVTVGSFLGTDYPGALEPYRAALPDLAHVFALDGSTHSWVRNWDELPADLSAGDGHVWDRARALRDDDVCDILFTSGTTGTPKGAMCTHGVTVRAFEVFCGVVGLRPRDRYLIVNPFFHAFGYKAGWLSCLLSGATAYPLPVFDVDEALATIRSERITVFPGPPTVYWSIMESGRASREDLASLRLSITGSTTVPTELIRRMQDELTFEHILVGFGLTEANGLGTMCRLDDSATVVTTTSGRVIPGMELAIADDGEILLRGHLMEGYFEDPTATGEAIDDQGWLHTGDIGWVDDDGNLHVTDRKKDMFIVGGFNVYPAEIEAMILAHPVVAQVAVVGAPDERLGEVGHAFVVPRNGATIDADELIAWCRSRVANFKAPRAVTVCEELPLTANGKVQKTVLRERVARR